MFDLKLKKFENSSVYFFLKNIEGFGHYNSDCLCKKFGFTVGMLKVYLAEDRKKS